MKTNNDKFTALRGLLTGDNARTVTLGEVATMGLVCNEAEKAVADIASIHYAGSPATWQLWPKLPKWGYGK